MTGHLTDPAYCPDVSGSPKGLLVIPGISRVAKEHPVRPGNLCHAPCLGNAPVGMKRRVAIKDLGYVPYSRLPSMRKDRNEDLCCPFPGNPVPEERLTIISSKPGPDAPVMIAAVTGVPSPVVRVRRRKSAKPVRCQERPGNCAKRSCGMFRADEAKSDCNHLVWPDRGIDRIDHVIQALPFLIPELPECPACRFGTDRHRDPHRLGFCQGMYPERIDLDRFPRTGREGSIHPCAPRDNGDKVVVQPGNRGRRVCCQDIFHYRLHLFHEGIVPPPAPVPDEGLDKP